MAEKNNSIVDIKDLPGDIVDATENIVVGVGRTAYKLPKFAQAVINIMNSVPLIADRASYIAIIVATTFGLWLIKRQN